MLANLPVEPRASLQQATLWLESGIIFLHIFLNGYLLFMEYGIDFPFIAAFYLKWNTIKKNKQC